jgi:hypothetical protein
MSRIVLLFVGVGVLFLFISIASLRARSPSESAWANKLVLPPRWLAPGFGLVPSIQIDPRAVPRGIVYFYWSSIAWLASALLFSQYAERGLGFVWYFAVVVAASMGVGWVIASLASRYWPFEDV